MKHLHNKLNREQDKLHLLALPGVIETKARLSVDFNAGLFDLVLPHRLAPPLLTPQVVQTVWGMYQEETVGTAFLLGP